MCYNMKEEPSIIQIKYENRLPLKNKLARLAWMTFSIFFFKPFPSKVFRPWRNCVLRLFGAQIASTASVHASVKIWAPWNLIVGEFSCISDNVDCYNVDRIVLRQFVTVSQRTFLCTASHNINSKEHELITSPIVIQDRAWVAAEAYIGMGVTIGEGSVVGARAAVYQDVENWTVVGGNPARRIKMRNLY